MIDFKLKSREFLKTPDLKRHFNRELFSAISREYTGMSRVLSFGRDLAWKRQMVAALPAIQAPRCLDLACGPGEIAGLLLAKYKDASVTGVDLTGSMLELARDIFKDEERVDFREMDMTATDFPDNSFDLITVGYGIRNAPDLDKALSEIGRLLSPGGVVAVLDFSRWDGEWLGAFELLLLQVWCGMWGLIRSGNADTYGYIADSLARFPARSELHERFAVHGLDITKTRRYFCGVIETIIASKRGH